MKSPLDIRTDIRRRAPSGDSAVQPNIRFAGAQNQSVFVVNGVKHLKTQDNKVHRLSERLDRIAEAPQLKIQRSTIKLRPIIKTARGRLPRSIGF